MTRQAFKTVDVLRLEVEQPTPGGTLPNLLANPDGLLGAWGWTHEYATLQTPPGAGFRLTGAASGPNPYLYSEPVPATPGKWYGGYFRLTGSTSASIRVEFYDAADAYLAGASNATPAGNLQKWVSMQAPANTARARLLIVVVPGVTATWDRAMLTEASTNPLPVPTTTAGFAYTAGPPFANILGPTHEIQVDREALNLGTLTAEVLDSTLDPAQVDHLRPGRRVRLLALDGAAWSPVFTGVTTQVDARYDDKATPPRPPRITLAAVDNAATLAAHRRPEGVATIAHLAHTLEGAGAPWSLNGNDDQILAPGVVSRNDNATALDQVALTRDSVRGYAWVDRRGVLVAYDSGTMPAAIRAVLDEGVYSSLDAAFTSTDCINSVTVKRLAWDLVDPTKSVEIVEGPFESLSSIARWGRRGAEFTVHGITAPQSAVFAADVLARNGDPAVRVGALTMPVKVAADIGGRALLDLYDLVTVVNSARSISQSLRVARITHRITPNKWLVDLGFAANGSVASPQVAPPLGASGAPADTPHALAALTANQGLVSGGWAALTGWTTLSASEVTVVGSTFTVARAGRYLLTATVHFSSTAAGYRAARWIINGTPTEYVAVGDAGAGAAPAVVLSGIYTLAAGTTLTLEANATPAMSALGGTGGHGFTRLAVERMGV